MTMSKKSRTLSVAKKTKIYFLPRIASAALPQSFRTAGFSRGAFWIRSRSDSRLGNLLDSPIMECDVICSSRKHI